MSCGLSRTASDGQADKLQELPAGSVLLAADLPDERGYTVYTWDASEEEATSLLPPARNGNDAGAFDAFPAWSTDGESVAFIRRRDGNLGLYVVGPGHDDTQLITDQVRTPYGLTWTLDGGRLSLNDEGVNGQPDIYTIDLEDGTRQNLTSSKTVELVPVWSPDGSQVAFMRREPEDVRLDLYVMDSDGSNLQNLSNSDENEGEPHWSPNGSRIAYVRAGVGIVVVDVDSGRSEVVVKDVMVGEPFLGGMVAWSPDGQRLAFVSQRDGNFDIFSVDLDNRIVHRLTATPDRNEIVSGWSPDGQQLLLITQPPGAPPDSNESAIWDLRTYDLSDESVETILSEVRFETFVMSLPEWKPAPGDN